MGAARHGVGQWARATRRHRGERGAAADRCRSGCRPDQPAVDPERVHPDAVRSAAARRIARRPARPSTGLRDRRHLVHRRLRALQCRADGDRAGADACPAGGGRCAADSRLAGHPPGGVPQAGPGHCGRCLGRAGRRCQRHRAGGGRRAGRVDPVGLAADLPDQRADRDRGGPHRPAAHPRDPGLGGHRAARCGRRSVGLPRPGRPGVRPNRRARAGLARLHDHLDCGWCAPARGLRRLRGSPSRSVAAPESVRGAPVHRGQPRHLRGVRSAGRRAVPAARPVAAGVRVHPGPGRVGPAAADAGDAAALGQGRRTCRADRSAVADDGGADRRRFRYRPVQPAGRRLRTT